MRGGRRFWAGYVGLGGFQTEEKTWGNVKRAKPNLMKPRIKRTSKADCGG